MQIFFWVWLNKKTASIIIFNPQINCLRMKKGSSELTLPHSLQSSHVILRCRFERMDRERSFDPSFPDCFAEKKQSKEQ